MDETECNLRFYYQEEQYHFYVETDADTIREFLVADNLWFINGNYLDGFFLFEDQSKFWYFKRPGKSRRGPFSVSFEMMRTVFIRHDFTPYEYFVLSFGTRKTDIENEVMMIPDLNKIIPDFIGQNSKFLMRIGNPVQTDAVPPNNLTIVFGVIISALMLLLLMRFPYLIK
ncbi:MAG: hypothetical protein GC181_12450 [Bacteroidetes bacterium]|nr:hypothetical protein [Bacteroidota bacterium]